MKFPILENNQINYQVKKSRGRKLTIKIKNDGLLVIAVPAFYQYSNVNKFIEDHLEWIIKNVSKTKTKPRYFVTGEDYLFLGENYKIVIIVSKHPAVIISENKIYVYSPSEDYETINKIVTKWKINQATNIFNETLYRVFQRMSSHFEKYPQLTIKEYKSRWGTCYYKRNLIILNLALIHTPIACIEYVICHELTHFKYPNHSEEFHYLVNSFVDERTCLKILKKYSPVYE